METRYIDRRFEIKELTEEGGVAGHASVFGVEDAYADIVARGAFGKTLAEHKRRGSMPKMLWQHDSREPIGVWEEMAEDSVGLYVSGRLILDVQRAREAHALMREGALDGLSIGFRTVESVNDDKTGLRTLTEVKLFEVSPVTFPALDSARISTVKAADIRSKRDLENALRDAGFSRRDAAWIASNWHLPAQRDAEGEGLDELAASIQAAAEQLIIC